MSWNAEREKPGCEMRIRDVHRGLWVALQCYSSGGCRDPKSYIYMYNDELLWSWCCCGDVCSHNQHCWEMTGLNQRYNCYDFVHHDGGSEHPRGTIIACSCIRNQCSVFRVWFNSYWRNRKKILLSFCRLRTKSGVCKSCSNVNPLRCGGLGLVRWKGKAARWALKGKSLLGNFDWMRCQKHSLAAKHSMKELKMNKLYNCNAFIRHNKACIIYRIAISYEIKFWCTAWV